MGLDVTESTMYPTTTQQASTPLTKEQNEHLDKTHTVYVYKIPVPNTLFVETETRKINLLGRCPL
jgi:hypothetical protein